MDLQRLRGPIELDGLNVRRDPLARPRVPLSDARTPTLKYTHTFIF